MLSSSTPTTDDRGGEGGGDVRRATASPSSLSSSRLVPLKDVVAQLREQQQQLRVDAKVLFDTGVQWAQEQGAQLNELLKLAGTSSTCIRGAKSGGPLEQPPELSGDLPSPSGAGAEDPDLEGASRFKRDGAKATALPTTAAGFLPPPVPISLTSLAPADNDPNKNTAHAAGRTGSPPPRVEGLPTTGVVGRQFRPCSREKGAGIGIGGTCTSVDAATLGSTATTAGTSTHGTSKISQGALNLLTNRLSANYGIPKFTPVPPKEKSKKKEDEGEQVKEGGQEEEEEEGEAPAKIEGVTTEEVSGGQLVVVNQGQPHQGQEEEEEEEEGKRAHEGGHGASGRDLALYVPLPPPPHGSYRATCYGAEQREEEGPALPHRWILPSLAPLSLSATSTTGSTTGASSSLSTQQQPSTARIHSAGPLGGSAAAGSTPAERPRRGGGQTPRGGKIHIGHPQPTYTQVCAGGEEVGWTPAILSSQQSSERIFASNPGECLQVHSSSSQVRGEGNSVDQDAAKGNTAAAGGEQQRQSSSPYRVPVQSTRHECPAGLEFCVTSRYSYAGSGHHPPAAGPHPPREQHQDNVGGPVALLLSDGPESDEFRQDQEEHAAGSNNQKKKKHRGRPFFGPVGAVAATPVRAPAVPSIPSPGRGKGLTAERTRKLHLIMKKVGSGAGGSARKKPKQSN